MPFLNAEQQFENRWVINAEMQANVVIRKPQQFADTLTINTYDVQAAFPA